MPSGDTILTGAVAIAFLVAAIVFEATESVSWRPDGVLSLSDLVPCCHLEAPVAGPGAGLTGRGPEAGDGVVGTGPSGAIPAGPQDARGR